MDVEQIKRRILNITSSMLHKFYCENDVEFLIKQMEQDIVWLGTAEHEWAHGLEKVSALFRQFAGQVPKCEIWGEEYQVIPMGPQAYLCSGRLWIKTEASTMIALRVHQRVTLGFRWKGEYPRCCHIHISNPYEDMVEEDVGFPIKIARQSYCYLQERIEEQRREIEAQENVLRRLSQEDSLTGIYNRNKFEQLMKKDFNSDDVRLGIAYFDLNGLKSINDRFGHANGDALLCRMAQGDV